MAKGFLDPDRGVSGVSGAKNNAKKIINSKFHWIITNLMNILSIAWNQTACSGMDAAGRPQARRSGLTR